MSRETERTGQATPEPNCSRCLWVVGLVFLGIAIAFSSILALKQLGLIGDDLPGCGPQSACGQVTSGPFGSIPGIDWPVSFLGLAWFIGLGVAWFGARHGVPPSLRWLARLGALASAGFVFIMLGKGTICPYCMIAHVGSLGFWVVIERTLTARVSTSAIQWGVMSFFLTTIVLAGGRMWRADVVQEQAVANESSFIDAVLAKEQQAASPVAAETSEPDSEELQPVAPIEPARDLLASRWTTGDPDAPVQVVMISDYQCPDCRNYEMEMRDVLGMRPDVALSVKHFPMCTDCNPNVKKTLHPNACWAARSAEAAGILGGDDAFWEMHEWLFENRGRFPGGQLPPIVDELGFDRREFTSVMTSDETLDRVATDIEDAVDLGLFYTPMIFINGVELKWHLIPSNLTTTINKVADAIADGTKQSEQIAPPMGLDKFVADWRDARNRIIKPSNREFKRPNVSESAPEVVVFIDFVSPGSATLLSEIRAWEREHGPVDLTLRVNPLDHACNPNLPERIAARPGSCLGARALKAAGVAGDDALAFEMAWWLMDNGPSLGSMRESDVVAHAVELGIDGEAFSRALNSAGVDTLVQQDVAEFKRHRFQRLPVVVVERQQVPRAVLKGHSVIGAVLDEVTAQSP